ncbi:MAG: septal ring lytic transglycosylase RlpA family protein [Syntrophaceae bacterium]|nr:septal ring lytic transglycosylase RlpA family protein [Syntrophaceae bacterium]
MEIKPTGNRVQDLNGTKTQTSGRKESKSFSAELKTAMGQESATTAPVGNKPVEYIVKKGDNLWNIGKTYKMNPYQIARDNGLSNPNMIRIGQKLIINSSSSQAAQTVQTVQPKVSGEVTASWYGAEHHNKKTASGQRFDMHKNTLAHKTLPIGTKVRLSNPDNGRVAEGIVNDRGPYIKGRDVDVSYAMAKQLGFVQKGVTKLTIEKI